MSCPEVLNNDIDDKVVNIMWKKVCGYKEAGIRLDVLCSSLFACATLIYSYWKSKMSD